MTFQFNRLLACGLMIAPAGAFAQDFSGAATLGYAHSSTSNGGGDENAYTLDGAGNFDFANGWDIGLTGAFAHADPDGGAGDVDIIDVGVDLQYRIISGAMFGAYVDYVDLDGNGLLAGSADATSYGFTAGYSGPVFQAVANVGSTDGSIATLGDSSDWMDYGVNLSYTPTEKTKIAGHWQLSDLDTGFNGTNIYSIGVGASHDFGAGFTGFGGVSRVDYNAANVEATSYGLGVGYDLSQISTVPAQVSLELARTNFDFGLGADSDVDTIRLGVTIPIGQRGGGAPLNSLADSIMTPRHNALSTLFDSQY